MLVGMRSMLRAGGRAFITLPRSCVDHSFTVTEHSFADALAAVGLPPVQPPTRPSRISSLRDMASLLFCSPCGLLLAAASARVTVAKNLLNAIVNAHSKHGTLIYPFAWLAGLPLSAAAGGLRVHRLVGRRERPN